GPVDGLLETFGIWGTGDDVDDELLVAKCVRRLLSGDPAHRATEVLQVDFGQGIGQCRERLLQYPQDMVVDLGQERRAEVVVDSARVERVEGLLPSRIRVG